MVYKRYHIMPAVINHTAHMFEDWRANEKQGNKKEHNKKYKWKLNWIEFEYFWIDNRQIQIRNAFSFKCCFFLFSHWKIRFFSLFWLVSLVRMIFSVKTFYVLIMTWSEYIFIQPLLMKKRIFFEVNRFNVINRTEHIMKKYTSPNYRKIVNEK